MSSRVFCFSWWSSSLSINDISFFVYSLLTCLPSTVVPGAAFLRVLTLFILLATFCHVRYCFSKESSILESLVKKSRWFSVRESGSLSVRNLDCPATRVVAGDVLDMVRYLTCSSSSLTASLLRGSLGGAPNLVAFCAWGSSSYWLYDAVLLKFLLFEGNWLVMPL